MTYMYNVDNIVAKRKENCAQQGQDGLHEVLNDLRE